MVKSLVPLALLLVAAYAGAPCGPKGSGGHCTNPEEPCCNGKTGECGISLNACLVAAGNCNSAFGKCATSWPPGELTGPGQVPAGGATGQATGGRKGDLGRGGGGSTGGTAHSPAVVSPGGSAGEGTTGGTKCGGDGRGRCPASAKCCSKFGWCGITPSHCGEGCQAVFSIEGACEASPVPPTYPSKSSPSSPGAHANVGLGGVSPGGSCGATHNDNVCPSDLPCCSEGGLCGRTVNFCGEGCQELYGQCVEMIDGTDGDIDPWTPAPGGESVDGTCGPDNNDYRCPSDAPCCSKWGWCGGDDEHCGHGCLPGYGTCVTPPEPKPGSITPDGTCGGTKGWICTKAQPCCSEYDWCGNTIEHCGNGCQSKFGDCGESFVAGRIRKFAKMTSF